MYSGSVCDLTLASGTVFNKILLWHLGHDQIGKRPEPDYRVKVSLSLSGHEAREKLAKTIICVTKYPHMANFRV